MMKAWFCAVMLWAVPALAAAQPASGTLQLIQAGEMEQAGDIDGAIAVYEAMYAKNSSNVIIANNLASLITTLPEVTSCWTLTGEADYLLSIWCADLTALNLLIQQRLLPHPAVARVQSQIVMDRLKDNTGLPL